MLARFSVAALALLAPGLGAQTALPVEPPAFATVSTLAGSGRIGVDDGPAARASFMMPTALARDAAGNVYVADYAAERIRKIASDGTVTTVAGGGAVRPDGLFVEGDRVNGPAAMARFYYPMGVAVDRKGAIYVAAAGIHVIRKIENGMVSTFAGSWDRGGDKQGPHRESHRGRSHCANDARQPEVAGGCRRATAVSRRFADVLVGVFLLVS